MKKLICSRCENKNICHCNECIHFYIGEHVCEKSGYKQSQSCLDDIKILSKNIKDKIKCTKYRGYDQGCFKKIDWVEKIKYGKLLKEIKCQA